MNENPNSIATDLGYIIVTVVVAMVIQKGVTTIAARGRSLIRR